MLFPKSAKITLPQGHSKVSNSHFVLLLSFLMTCVILHKKGEIFFPWPYIKKNQKKKIIVLIIFYADSLTDLFNTDIQGLLLLFVFSNTWPKIKSVHN